MRSRSSAPRGPIPGPPVRSASCWGPPPPPHSARPANRRTCRPAVPPTSPVPTSLGILYNKFFQGVFRLTRDFGHLAADRKPPPGRGARSRPASDEICVLPGGKLPETVRVDRYLPPAGRSDPRSLSSRHAEGEMKLLSALSRPGWSSCAVTPRRMGGNCTRSASDRRVKGKCTFCRRGGASRRCRLGPCCRGRDRRRAGGAGSGRAP